MRKLIAGVIVAAAALVVSAASAFAIHDPNVPAGVCSNPDSEAVGHPATGKANTAFSNTVLAEHNNASPRCAFAP
jgi:hypothetical protein